MQWSISRYVDEHPLALFDVVEVVAGDLLREGGKVRIRAGRIIQLLDIRVFDLLYRDLLLELIQLRLTFADLGSDADTRYHGVNQKRYRSQRDHDDHRAGQKSSTLALRLFCAVAFSL